MTKLLDGRELSGFIKERQARLVRSLRGRKIFPKLLILRDNPDPVIEKYVSLKQKYGADIGVEVEDFVAKNTDELLEKIDSANKNTNVSGIIVQLPLKNTDTTDLVVSKLNPKKDVDGLSGCGEFDSATATAINWLLAGYDIDLKKSKIALVGRGRLVGAPLLKIFTESGYNVSMYHRGDDLSILKQFDVVITATGQPGLIKSVFLKPGAVVVDAGTASEGGVLKGDLEEAARSREDLSAITPKFGGVGPMTISVLFENVLYAAQNLEQD